MSPIMCWELKPLKIETAASDREQRSIIRTNIIGAPITTREIISKLIVMMDKEHSN
jgi:hypothetical protein